MKKNNKWYLIYFVLIIISFSFFLWIAVINKKEFFEKNTEYIKNSSNLTKSTINQINDILYKYNPESKTNISWITRSNNYENIFYINDEIINYISWNTLNQTNTWNIFINNSNWSYLNLKANWEYNLKIVEFNKENFNKNSSLKAQIESSFTWIMLSDGFLNNDWTFSVSTWSLSKEFDLKNKDYAIFLKSKNINLIYELYFLDKDSWKKIYIYPILDDTTNLKIMSYKIDFTEQNQFFLNKFSKTKTYNYANCGEILADWQSFWSWFYNIFSGWVMIYEHCDM